MNISEEKFINEKLDQIKSLRAQLAEANAARECAEEKRKHTQKWYASHYGKLEDWARTRLPEKWSKEFFWCIANGTWGFKDNGTPYHMADGSKIVPSNYFKMDTAERQLILDQTQRAEEANAARLKAEAACAEMVDGIKQSCSRLAEQWFFPTVMDEDEAEAIDNAKISLAKAILRICIPPNPGSHLLERLKAEAACAEMRLSVEEMLGFVNDYAEDAVKGFIEESPNIIDLSHAIKNAKQVLTVTNPGFHLLERLKAADKLSEMCSTFDLTLISRAAEAYEALKGGGK